MATYYIKFKHTLEQTYTAKIEADSEKEALEIFDEDPFGNLIEIIETKEG